MRKRGQGEVEEARSQLLSIPTPVPGIPQVRARTVATQSAIANSGCPINQDSPGLGLVPIREDGREGREDGKRAKG